MRNATIRFIGLTLCIVGVLAIKDLLISQALAGGPPVSIRKNTDPDVGTREIVSRSIRVDLNSCNTTDSITVPAGRRLVIENISAWAFVLSGVTVYSVGLEFVDTLQLFVVVPVVSAGGDGTLSFFAGGQQMHIYADSAVAACAFTNPASGFATVFVSGYYVDKR